MEDLFILKEFIIESLLDEASKKKKNTSHHKNYSAPKGSKRAKQLDATKADLASGDPKRKARAFKRRERMEKEARENPSFVNKPRSDSKK